MRTHNIKIEDDYYDNICLGRKKVEIRRNDRDYQGGDILDFLFEDGEMRGDGGRYLITHVHSGYGMQEGFVALSIAPLPEKLGGVE